MQRTSLCLGQSGTFRACPPPDKVIKPLNMGCQTAFFNDSLMLLIWDDGSVSIPKVGEANILLENLEHSALETTIGRDTLPNDNERNNPSLLFTKCQPQVKRVAPSICNAYLWPAFSAFITYKRPHLVEF